MIAPMQYRQTASPHPSAPGVVAVYDGTVMTLSIWAYSVESVGVNPKGPGIQIGMKTGAWFPADVSVGEFTTAQGAAMQAWVKEERMLKLTKAA
jgi:hypothetical protein